MSLDCEIGAIYSLHSRNLNVGVYTIEGTFIGIRTKFDSAFLFAELHKERGGTATPLQKLGHVLSGITLKVSLGTIDSITGRIVKFDRPISEGGLGWIFVDTGESSRTIRPVAMGNPQLFQLLKDAEL